MSETVTSQDNLAARMVEVEKTLEKLMTKMSEIYNAVVGNETFDQTGIIARIKKLEVDNESNKALKNKLIGAFLAGGAVWTVIWELFKLVIKK